MDPTNKTLEITFDGKVHTLYFDINTFAAFEEEAKMTFPDFLLALHKTGEAVTADKDNPRPEEMFRYLSFRHMRAFLWASLHTYDAKDNPIWPYTAGRLSRMLSVGEFMDLLMPILTAIMDNMPKPSKKDEAQTARPTQAKEPEVIQPNGVKISGPSDEELLASLELTSDASA